MWPTIASDVQKACESCHQCQKKRRVTVYDRMPITPIPRGDVSFDSLVIDCLGPLFSNQKVEYNYALVLCDSNTRYPFAVPLRTLTYITESSTKSAKLIRWLLSLQSYNVTFKYKEGRKNVVADCLSRLDSATE